MTLTYKVTKDYEVEVLDGGKKVDLVGPFDSAEGAELWGSAVCEKYNSADFADVKYPEEAQLLLGGN